MLPTFSPQEMRIEPRVRLLELLGTISVLDAAALPVLKHSRLPVELSRELTTDVWDAKRSSLVYYSLLLCTMMFADGTALAVEHYTMLGEPFVGSLLDMLEHKCETADELRSVEQALSLLLAFNKHFGTQAAEGMENVVLSTLRRRTCGSLGERVLLFFNRGTVRRELG